MNTKEKEINSNIKFENNFYINELESKSNIKNRKFLDKFLVVNNWIGYPILVIIFILFGFIMLRIFNPNFKLTNIFNFKTEKFSENKSETPFLELNSPKIETVEISTITFNKNSLELFLNNTEQITATILPEEATNKRLTWSSSDTTIATVDNTRYYYCQKFW